MFRASESCLKHIQISTNLLSQHINIRKSIRCGEATVCIVKENGMGISYVSGSYYSKLQLI